MTDVDRLFADYIAEHKAGAEADPRAYLERASGGDRLELMVLIDGYLAGAPRRPFARTQYTGSGAEAIVDGLERSLSGANGLWPALLPQLRHRAGLKRTEIVARLSDALDVRGREDRIAGYYHEMEQGLLPVAGVSDRVLAALGEIVGTTAQALREAGTAPAPPAGTSAAQAAFARRASAPEQPGPAPVAAADAADAESEPDELDRLFRGG